MNERLSTFGYFLRGLPVWLIIQILSQLSPTAARAICRPLGLLLRLVLYPRMQIAKVNLKQCFPEMTDIQRKALLIQHSRQQVYGLYETTQAVLRESADLPEYRIDGIEGVQAATQSGNGVLLVAGHFTGMDLWLRLVGEMLPLVAVHRPLKNPLMQKYFGHGRRRSSQQLISKHKPRAILNALKAGQIVWIQSDQNSRGRNSRFIDFFGHAASTSISPWWLAHKSGAMIYTVHPSKNWVAGNYRYRVSLQPIGSTSSYSEPDQLLLAINKKLEQAVQTLPASYWWVHRRFKTRPPGQATIYRH